MKRITTIFIAALVSMAASAQKYAEINFDVCGIELGTKLTKEQIIQRFGNPVSIRVDKGDEPEDHIYTKYYFEKIVLTIDSVEGLCSFTVYSPDYPVLTSMVNKEGIKVGDSMDVLKRYPITSLQIRPELKNYGYRKLDADIYTFYLFSDDVQSIEVKNGKIVSISLKTNTTGY